MTSGPAGVPSKGSTFKREEGREQRGKCRRRHVYHTQREARNERDKLHQKERVEEGNGLVPDGRDGREKGQPLRDTRGAGTLLQQHAR